MLYIFVVVEHHQWNLVCDQTYLVPLSQTSYMVGSMFGSVLFGGLADRYFLVHVCLLLFGNAHVLLGGPSKEKHVVSIIFI